MNTVRNRAVIFDGDDTLWETQPLYEAAKQDFVLLLRQHGIVHDAAVALLDEIDAEQVLSLGFSRERFPSSMVRAYEEVCSDLGLTPNLELRTKLLGIGRSVFEKVPRLYSDAVRSLKSLRDRYVLVLATKGDLEVQRKKIAALRLRRYFDQTYIVEEKTDREYLEIVNDLQIGPSCVWVVGNSVRSDINPALRAGLRAILIPRGNWEYERHDHEGRGVFVVNSLSEAVAVIYAQDRITLHTAES